MKTHTQEIYSLSENLAGVQSLATKDSSEATTHNLSAFMTHAHSLQSSSRNTLLLGEIEANHPARKYVHASFVFMVQLLVILSRFIVWGVNKVADGLWYGMQWLKQQWHEQTKTIPVTASLFETHVTPVTPSHKVSALSPHPSHMTIPAQTVHKPKMPSQELQTPPIEDTTENLRAWLSQQELKRTQEPSHTTTPSQATTPTPNTNTKGSTEEVPMKRLSLDALADSIEALL
jgi:hypothetical protein